MSCHILRMAFVNRFIRISHKEKFNEPHRIGKTKANKPFVVGTQQKQISKYFFNGLMWIKKKLIKL